MLKSPDYCVLGCPDETGCLLSRLRSELGEVAILIRTEAHLLPGIDERTRERNIAFGTILSAVESTCSADQPLQSS